MWQADPAAGWSAAFLTHQMLERHQAEAGMGLDTYQAIELVHALASG